MFQETAPEILPVAENFTVCMCMKFLGVNALNYTFQAPMFAVSEGFSEEVRINIENLYLYTD